MKSLFLFPSNGAERSLRRNASVVASAFFLLLFVGAISAQEYKEAPVDDTFGAKKDAVLAAGNAADVKDFLNKYYLARWTVQKNNGNLYDYRKELQEDATRLSGDAQKVFLESVVDRLSKYAKADSIFPACRYNAILAIGALDTTAGATNRDPGVPYAGALATLADFCSTTDKTPDYIRLGALIGLVRHAALSPNDETKKIAAPVFGDVLKDGYGVDKELRPEIFAWFQLKALEGLTNFKSPAGSNGATETLDLLKATIDDADRDFELRALAARGIGEMNLTDAACDYVALADSLVKLARDFCEDESKFIDSEVLRDQVKSASSAATGAGMGGMGGMGGMAEGGTGADMGMGAGALGGGMGGGMGGEMGGGLQQKSLETVVARVRYGFESVQFAIQGVDGGTGVAAKLTADDEKTKDAKANLDSIVDEIKKTVEFIENGPENDASSLGAMMGGEAIGYGGGTNKKGKKTATISVGSALLKDHLLEKKNLYNEMMGVDSL